MQNIDYMPVAGPTIHEAFKKAVEMARTKNRVIVAEINDVVMHISPNATVDNEIKRFREMLQICYAIQDARQKVQ